MIDIHSHLLYEIDDGPSKIEDSERMLSEAEKIGINHIICTAHYHENLFQPDEIMDRIHTLSVVAGNLDIRLYPGYEVFIDSVNESNLHKVVSLTLAGSRFMLVEFPLNKLSDGGLEMLSLLRKRGIVPIIAHPERCKVFYEDFTALEGLFKSGCLMQVDAASIIGVYGKLVKRFSLELIKKGMVHFVASNAHFPEDYSARYEKAYDAVNRLKGEWYAYMVFNSNPKRVLENSELFQKLL